MGQPSDDADELACSLAARDVVQFEPGPADTGDPLLLCPAAGRSLLRLIRTIPGRRRFRAGSHDPCGLGLEGCCPSWTTTWPKGRLSQALKPGAHFQPPAIHFFSCP